MHRLRNFPWFYPNAILFYWPGVASWQNDTAHSLLRCKKINNSYGVHGSNVAQEIKFNYEGHFIITSHIPFLHSMWVMMAGAENVMEVSGFTAERVDLNARSPASYWQKMVGISLHFTNSCLYLIYIWCPILNSGTLYIDIFKNKS